MTGEIDLFDERESLSSIRDFSRQRIVSPGAVLPNVIMRACTSAPAHVMIPPMIGSAKPLNVVVVTVGPSGLGKTASDDTAEDYWPAPIPIFPFGTAEGTVQAFDPDDDGQPQINNVIFSSSEIDAWAALGERAGSLTFPVLRQMVTGDQLGMKNASKAHTRVVAKRSYRVGISLSAQPGSTGAAILFRDAPGGFPQRCLFGSAVDPDVPDAPPVNVEPFRPAGSPDFSPNAGPYYEIPFPDSVIAEVREHHRMVLRGVSGADPLDGHRNLTKAKVSAGLMIMEGRNHVTDDDWRIAGRIMDTSDRVRAELIAATEQAARNANRARALAAADREEVASDRKLERTKQGIVRWLGRHRELSSADLRRKVKADLRDHLHTALSELADEGQILLIQVDRGTRYRLAAEGTRCTESTPRNLQVSGGVPQVHGVPDNNVTDLNTRRSCACNRPKISCREWFNNHIQSLRDSGETTAESLAVYAAGEAEGYSRPTLYVAANRSPIIEVIENRTSAGATWRIKSASEEEAG